MKLSRTITYALKAMVSLSRSAPGVPVSGRHLAELNQLPERYLHQILRRLVSQGVLLSSVGVTGGYCLSRAPKEITLLDIVDAFENPFALEMRPAPGLSDFVQTRLSLFFA